MDSEDAFTSFAVHGGQARAVVRPSHARRLCEGHLPGDPFLPGAHLVGLMAEVAARLVAARSGPASALREVVRCVFLTPVRPDVEIVVTTAEPGDGRAPEPSLVDAEVRVRGAVAAHATLRFASPT